MLRHVITKQRTVQPRRTKALVNGGDGNDTALMGAGNDTFMRNPGDDNDIVEGQSGVDTMLFSGANIAENIDISANGGGFCSPATSPT